MANNLKKTSDLYGNAVDLLAAIPGMGVDIIGMLSTGVTAGKIKTDRMLANVIRDDKITAVSADKQAIYEQALEACQAEESFWRAVDPATPYDLKANVLQRITQITAALAA